MWSEKKFVVEIDEKYVDRKIIVGRSSQKKSFLAEVKKKVCKQQKL